MINLDLLRSEIGKCRIAVIGDIMLDRYISGSVKRVSPEAPVPESVATMPAGLRGGRDSPCAGAAGDQNEGQNDRYSHGL